MNKRKIYEYEIQIRNIDKYAGLNLLNANFSSIIRI